MKENYRVIKLKSGEELIAEVSTPVDGKVTLLKPMVFKTIVVSDPMGMPKEGIVLKNWLAFGNQTETTIPEDFIATTLEPTQDVVSYYISEKDKNGNVYEKTKVEDSPTNSEPKDIADYENMISDMFKTIFKDLEDVTDEPQIKKSKRKSKKDIDHIIHMNMMFKPEALAHMINEGMIDPREIMDMIEHFGLNNKKPKKKLRESINEQKYTGEQKDRKDFGNKWTDWNPDPNSDDYN